MTKKKLFCGFLSTNIYSQLQHIYYKAYSLLQIFKLLFLHFWRYNWYQIISLDFLLLIKGGLFKYLLLSFFPLLIHLCFIVTVILDNIIYNNNFTTNFTTLKSYLENINKSQISPWLIMFSYLVKWKSLLFLLLLSVLYQVTNPLYPFS